MRSIVARPAILLGQPHWTPDDHFDVGNHLRQVGAPGDGSLEAAIRMASQSATAPFDPARPLWDAVLVTGIRDERAVLLLRVHHAVADGVRAIAMMANLLDLEPNPPESDTPSLEQRGSALVRTTATLFRATNHTAATQQARARRTTRAVLRTAFRPVGTATDAIDYTRSALRTFSAAGAEPSALFKDRSRARRYGSLDLDMTRMRHGAKHHDATINDVFLTGLLGGLRRYHQEMGLEIRDVPLSFPIDVSGTADPDSGNHFSAAVIPGPSSEGDPVERLRAVHDLVAARRTEPGLDAPTRLAPVLNHVPGKLASAGLAAYARRVDVQASNIIGPDCPLFLAGTQVGAFYAFGPLPGVPVMAVLVSYDGRCTIGFTIDPAAVTDPDLLVRLTGEAFEELLTAANTSDEG